VGGFIHGVKKAWPCLGSATERPWLGLGGPISPCRASSFTRLALILIEVLTCSWWVWLEARRMAKITSGSSFEPHNPEGTEIKVLYTLKMTSEKLWVGKGY